MSKKAPTKKQAAQKKASPPVEETKAPVEVTLEEQLAAPEAPQEPAAAQVVEPAAQEQEAAAPAAEPATLLVRVGSNSAAGRVMLGRTIYDGHTARPMARADFERLKATYDLQVVEE